MSAFAISLRLGGFPDLNALHSSHWQILSALLAFAGMVETARCLDRRWSLYHAGVLMLLYTDLMILAMAVVLFLYP
ncbi:MAG TPA: permease [Terracidiphilus sp.]